MSAALNIFYHSYLPDPNLSYGMAASTTGGATEGLQSLETWRKQQPHHRRGVSRKTKRTDDGEEEDEEENEEEDEDEEENDEEEEEEGDDSEGDDSQGDDAEQAEGDDKQQEGDDTATGDDGEEDAAGDDAEQDEEGAAMDDADAEENEEDEEANEGDDETGDDQEENEGVEGVGEDVDNEQGDDKDEDEEELVGNEDFQAHSVDMKPQSIVFKRQPPPMSPYVVPQIKIPTWWQSAPGRQVVKTDKDGQPLHHNIRAVRAEDLKGIGGEMNTTTTLTVEEASKGREQLLAILRDADVTDIDAASIARLPTWEKVVSLYGEGPVIYGLDTCKSFRNTVPAEDASIGTAGLFNTGTNPFAMYISANCHMPKNTKEKFHGMRWQVPWGKHMLASRKMLNTAAHDSKVDKDHVLPVVLVRDPFSWMQSMCRHPYAARWVHDEDHCPDLVPTAKDKARHAELANRESVPVVIGYPHKHVLFDSLAHLWSQWYQEYVDVDYPRLIIRFEDLIFHPKQVISTVCACAGAEPKEDVFSYVVGEAKWGSSVHKGSSNMISAMIQYGSDEHRFKSLTYDDLKYANEHISPELLRMFQYPPIPEDILNVNTAESWA